MIQKAMQCFESACGKAKIFVENDMPIGVFHDFLMELKGAMVERMVAAHKQQQEEVKQQDLAADENCADQELHGECSNQEQCCGL